MCSGEHRFQHCLALIIMYSFYRTIDILDWNSLINDRAKVSELLVVPNVEVSATDCTKRNTSQSILKRKGC